MTGTTSKTTTEKTTTDATTTAGQSAARGPVVKKAATAPKISISQSGWLWRAGLLGLCTGLGCGGGAPADVTLLWRLADGRSCVDTAIIRAVAEIEGQTPKTMFEGRCSERPENNRLQLPQVAPGARILLRAETLSMIPIYRGELRVESPVPPFIETELYYTGGL